MRLPVSRFMESAGSQASLRWPGLLLLLALLCQCSKPAPKQQRTGQPEQGAEPESDQKTEPAKVKPANAREVANRHLEWLAGADLETLDRAFFRFALEKLGKPGQIQANGSAWLSREGKARLSLRRGEDAIQLSFVSKNQVLRGPATGPFAPAEEQEAKRILELTTLMQCLLGWDLLQPKVQLDLIGTTVLESKSVGSPTQPGQTVRRGWSQLAVASPLESLSIDGTTHDLEGARAGLRGSLPERIQLPAAKQVLHIEAWLTKAEFKPGYLDPKRSRKQTSALVMGEEQENKAPTLHEYGPVWEVAIKDPGDWKGRVRVLADEIPQPFMDAQLRPAGLPTLTDNGKMLIHVLPTDETVTRPKAPKGYRLQKREGRISAVVYVRCTWAEAEKTLQAKLGPYLQELGLRARGPLWMSPYLDWSRVREAPPAAQKIKIRGEIRVR